MAGRKVMKFSNGVRVTWSDADRAWLVKWHEDTLEKHDAKVAAVDRAITLERDPDALFRAFQKLHERSGRDRRRARR